MAPVLNTPIESEIDATLAGRVDERPSAQIEVFFDGACPICRREVACLKRMDRNKRLRMIDISDSHFDPSQYGISTSEFTREIHARLPSGSWVTGVEVFRRVYEAVGLGYLVGVTRLPGIRQLLDIGYRWFARNRLRLTCRCDATEGTFCEREQAE